jgi:hypothetical protein
MILAPVWLGILVHPCDLSRKKDCEFKTSLGYDSKTVSKHPRLGKQLFPSMHKALVQSSAQQKQMTTLIVYRGRKLKLPQFSTLRDMLIKLGSAHVHEISNHHTRGGGGKTHSL